MKHRARNAIYFQVSALTSYLLSSHGSIFRLILRAMDIKGNALVVGRGTQTTAYLVGIPLMLDLIGSGIGKACALLLAKEGASGILLADIDLSLAANVAAECTALAINDRFHSEAFQVNITIESAVQNLFHRMTESFGRIDYCIDSAGVSRPFNTALV
jgi:hypothetical protein